ncbi:hypothetical protein [Streptomyces sp. CNQ085]|uniref:hypothetical protein n=1 Tax=Streptomyces sp. CNQ085 TaxID=2886944 RepID=UPI001F508095|nr:hypothetical protein [Streptomyces sp. CNQ085]MCI0383337.1 hypothetical protein [Streptomyces sp. CNQ085]
MGPRVCGSREPAWPRWGCSLASGCGGDGGADGKVAIRTSWWGAQDRADLINRIMDLSEKGSPGIEAKTDFQER